MYNQAIVIANDEGKDKRDKKESTAVALRLKPESEKRFLNMIRMHFISNDIYFRFLYRMYLNTDCLTQNCRNSYLDRAGLACLV